jgi:glycosyltransferase
VKISVITVTYNSASTIVDTLKSVVSQTHADIEHLIIDGGSKDDTLALIAAQGTRARVVSEPDRGIYDAMNKGLRMATGDIVGFLNSDDVYASPEVLASIAHAAEQRRADAVFGDLVYINPSRPKPLVRYWRAGKFTMRGLKLGWMPPHPTLYVRRRIMQEVGPFDADLRVAADYEFILRLLKRPGLRIAYVPRVLVHMRVGGASNKSVPAMLTKSREDLGALRRHRVGGIATLIFKNLRKLPQFVRRPRA